MSDSKYATKNEILNLRNIIFNILFFRGFNTLIVLWEIDLYFSLLFDRIQLPPPRNFRKSQIILNKLLHLSHGIKDSLYNVFVYRDENITDNLALDNIFQIVEKPDN